MMNLPSAIRVGYRDFKVEDWPASEGSAASRYGECDKANAVIRVCRVHGDVKAANTLLHEVLHAAWDIGSLPDEAEEEIAVRTLANVLAQVWRDNPAFVAFMSEALA